MRPAHRALPRVSSHWRLTIAEADFVGPADNTTKPIDAVYAVERSIDRRRDDALAPRTLNRFARGIIDGDRSDAQIDVEGKEHPPSPIGAFMRGAMTETVEMFASKPGARAAPNVPAYFHDARRRESKDAEATEGADKKRRAFVELKNQGDATIGRFEVALLECEHVLTAQDRAAPRFAIAAARAALEGGDPEKLKKAAELLERAATLIEVAASKRNARRPARKPAAVRHGDSRRRRECRVPGNQKRKAIVPRRACALSARPRRLMVGSSG